MIILEYLYFIYLVNENFYYGIRIVLKYLSWILGIMKVNLILGELLGFRIMLCWFKKLNYFF